MKSQFFGLLKDIGFIGKGMDMNSKNLSLVKGVICAGLFPNVFVSPNELVDGSNKKEVGECR